MELLSNKPTLPGVYFMEQSMTWGDAQKYYKSPDHCMEPDPLHPLGCCWSLIYGLITPSDRCEDCDMSIHYDGRHDPNLEKKKLDEQEANYD